MVMVAAAAAAATLSERMEMDVEKGKPISNLPIFFSILLLPSKQQTSSRVYIHTYIQAQPGKIDRPEYYITQSNAKATTTTT
jgi:hypothetical protein